MISTLFEYSEWFNTSSEYGCEISIIVAGLDITDYVASDLAATHKNLGGQEICPYGEGCVAVA